MEVAAIILTGGLPDRPFTSGEGTTSLPGMLGNAPIPLQDLLGRPIVHRMVDLLRAQSVGRIIVLSDQPVAGPAFSRSGSAEVSYQVVEPSSMWRSAEAAFNELVQASSDEVLVLRMGAYLHLDVQDLLAHHFNEKCRITSVVAPNGLPLEVFAASANRRNDMAFLLRHALQETRTPCKNYVFRGYMNRLENARDFRRLTQDALLQRIDLRPVGEEIRPGIWVGKNARVHPLARLVAPVFIGRRSRVLSGAVVTRCGVVEHHSVVSAGGVVEDATVLPHTWVGPGLELTQAVAGAGRVISLRRNVEVEINDPRLIHSISTHAPVRILTGLVSLAAFLPAQFLRGLFTPFRKNESSPSLAVSGTRPQAAECFEARESVADFVADTVVARRYGDE